MKYCSKCGKQLEDNDKFCTECGEQLVKNEIPVAYSQTQQVNSTTIYPNGETEEERKEGNKLGIISLCLYFGAPVVSFILLIAFCYITCITTDLSGCN